MYSIQTSRRQLLGAALAGAALSHAAPGETREGPGVAVTPDDIELPDALHKIALRVYREAKITVEKTVAHEAEPRNYPLPADPNSLEQIVWERFKMLTSAHKQAAIAITMPRLRATRPSRQKLYKDLAIVNLQSPVPVARQVDTIPYPRDLQIRREELEASVAGANRTPDAPTPSVTTPSRVTKLTLRVHKVKCLDETGGSFAESFGNDEISLGGVAVDESGDTHKIPHFSVNSNFDDGESKVYNPPKFFTTFNLLEGTAFPKIYTVTLALTEIDGGGFTDFIHKLYMKIRERVIAAIVAAVGGFIGLSGGIIGAAIGAAVGWVVGSILDWIIGLFRDDMFRPRTVRVSIPSYTYRFVGGLTHSPDLITSFTGHDGHYQLTYDWLLTA